MSWSTWRVFRFLTRSRHALNEANRALAEKRQEIARLRARLDAQQQRLEDEKRRRRQVEQRLARRKERSHALPRVLTPHRQAFQFATAADAYHFATVVSYPKSGRTWFSTLYFHYARAVLGAADLVQQSLHMPDRNLAFQQLLADKAKHGAFPVCVFTHLGFSGRKPFESSQDPWPDKAHSLLKRPAVLIVRDPRDVVVSHYHHLRAVGGVLDPSLALSDFIRGSWGIERIVRFMNLFGAALAEHHKNIHLCSDESLKRDTAGAFSAAMTFLRAPLDPAAVEQAVAESSFDRLKDQERSSRSYQGASLEPDAFRFRKGDIGGYARELSSADAEYLNQVVADRLDRAFECYK